MISTADILNAGILIVDDQKDSVHLLRQMLHDAGYRNVTSTRDPARACELHRTNRYDLILLDPQVPGMDGFEVMKRLMVTESTGYAPILAASDQPGLKLRALASGAKDFISKPYDLLEAYARIRNMLEVRLLYKELAQHSQTQEVLALHDALTGLPNRRLLDDRLSLAIAHARRNKSAMAVMYLDLDGFKQINDTLGHNAGDTLLRAVATRLVAAVRQEDTVARMGGDEFVIAMWELNNTDCVAKLVSKLIETVSQPYNIESRTVCMTASIGIGIYPTHGEDAESLMNGADKALYEAKRMGKNDYCIATHHEQPPASRTLRNLSS